MAYLEDLKERYVEHQRRLQKRKLQQAKLGDSADPNIFIEIEDIENELAELDNEIGLHSKLLNLFQRYEIGFAELLDRIRQDPGRGQVLKYQRRLRDQMDYVRKTGDMPNGQAERTEIVWEINDFAIEEVGKGFYEFCGISPGASASELPAPAPPPSQSPRPSAPHDDTARPSIGSINAQNVVFGDQTIGNQININTTNHYPGSEKRHQSPIQRSDQDALNQHILALEQAVKQQAAPELIEPAREQALVLQRAFSAVDVSNMVTVLTWFEQHLPTLSSSVRAIICHQIVRRRVNAAGMEAVREFQRRFGKCDDSQERQT